MKSVKDPPEVLQFSKTDAHTRVIDTPEHTHTPIHIHTHTHSTQSRLRQQEEEEEERIVERKSEAAKSESNGTAKVSICFSLYFSYLTNSSETQLGPF